jgi:hypothetical protein
MTGLRHFRSAAVVVVLIAAIALGSVSATSHAGKPPCEPNTCGTTASATTATTAQTAISLQSASVVRGIYASWPYVSEYPTIAGLGFNAVAVGAYRDRLDDLQSLGLKGLVWLGGYDNTTCTFVYSDGDVRTHIAAINGHSAILAYEIDNEPHADTCPTAPQQIKQRVALVRSLVGPNIILYLTLSKNFQAFAHTGVDLIRISAYPCSYTSGCVMQKIVAKVGAARAAGFTRIWGGTQTAGDGYYRPPTPAELALIQQTWRDQGAEGYVAWAWDTHGTTDPLRTNTALWDTWKVENTK